jgi:hypothetical protein
MRTAAVLLLLMGALFGSPVHSVAQVRFGLTPRLGWYVPLRQAGAVAPVNETWFLQLERIDPSVSFELSADVMSRSGVGVRVMGLVTAPVTAKGAFNCYPGVPCPAILSDTEADVQVATLLADLVYAPFAGSAAVRPYAALGAGVRRFHASYPNLAALIEADSRTEHALALHAALGAEFELFGAVLRAEVADYYSSNRIAPPEGSQAEQSPKRIAQHDLGISLGWRLLRF